MTNNIGIEYITDEAGNISKVLIAYEDWQRIEAGFKEWMAFKAQKNGDNTPAKTFNAIKLDTKNFKFNRDEANK